MRHRRRDPQRTGPIRNAAEAWREGETSRDPERRDDDASRGVREGYRVIEEQIRRGRRMAQALDGEDRRADSPRGRRRPREEDQGWNREPRGGFRFLESQMRRTERLVREILRQISSARPDPWRLSELVFRLYVESVSDLVLLGFDAFGALAPRRGDRFEEDVERIDRDIEESFEEEDDFEGESDSEPWDWPAPPSAPTVIRATVPIPVYIVSHERTEIDLDLPAGSQSLELEIERPMASGVDHRLRPAFEAELVALADGPAILRLEVPRDLPTGRYQRRVLIRATGEPVGTLTVQVGTDPVVEQP
jgi:hypothetical protein